jgi:hypothetical protein
LKDAVKSREQAEPAYPVGIAITHRFDPPLPIEDGVFEIPNPQGEDYTLMLFVATDDPKHQVLLLLPPGVVFVSERSGAIENHLEVVDEEKVRHYFQYICETLSGETGLRLKTKHTPDFPFNFTDQDGKKTRLASPQELVAVYETSTEVINNFLLASKCAFPNRLLYFPQFDEDYISPVAFEWLDFFYYTPTLKTKIQKPLVMRTLADKFEFETVTGQEFLEKIKPIMSNRADYLIEIMAVSANRCLRDGEYEASLVMLESVFETSVKNAIEKYYEETLPGSEYQRRIESIFRREGKDGGSYWVGIEELVKKQLPRCGYPALPTQLLEEWKMSRRRRQEVVHHHKQPVTKEEVLKSFWLYQQMTQHLFKKSIWFLGDRPGYSIHFGSSTPEANMAKE